MPCNYKMGNGVRGFPAYMGWYGGGGERDERFRGEGESRWCVFEWKCMMYCVSLCKLIFMFPCVNVISIQGSP